MKIKLEFSVEEVNLIIQGLGEIPAKLSMNLIQRIQDEATEQLQPKSYIENGTQTDSEDLSSIS